MPFATNPQDGIRISDEIDGYGPGMHGPPTWSRSPPSDEMLGRYLLGVEREMFQM